MKLCLLDKLATEQVTNMILLILLCMILALVIVLILLETNNSHNVYVASRVVEVYNPDNNVICRDQLKSAHTLHDQARK